MANRKLQEMLGISACPNGSTDSRFPIQKVFQSPYGAFYENGASQSDVQKKAAHALIRCKSGNLGCNVSICGYCGHTEVHNNSCHNRHCPNCQTVLKEVWMDKCRSEVIGSPYFHVVFTLPHELKPLLYCNHKPLYSLLHKCCSQTLLELCKNKKYLGATSRVIQILHTWNQELSYHVHMHCILSGGGLTPERKIRYSKEKFFLPVYVMRDLFKGKYLAGLDQPYRQKELLFSASCEELRNSYECGELRDRLLFKDWCPYIKETSNGFGNAIEYLGRYTHKIAVYNISILSVTDTRVTFSARGRRPVEPKRGITLGHMEFIRRFLMHVLPLGFQKFHYYGFLNNRYKSKSLKLIFSLQGSQRFQSRYTGMSMAELLKAVWNLDIRICPVCGRCSMKLAGKTYDGTS